MLSTSAMEWESLLTKILNSPTACVPVLPSVTLRVEPEDFQVEEIPTYLPVGTGEHLFLWIEKRDVSASDLIARLARTLKVSTRDIGVAGQKDRRAVTRQFVSVPRICKALLPAADCSDIRILSVSAHTNKLRTGHLTGNRFRIVLRAPDGLTFQPQDADLVRDRLLEIEANGFPNYFGPQRFGFNGSSIRDGIGLLKGEFTAKRWKPNKRRFMSRMVASAVQSTVFNLVVADRVLQHQFAEPIAGDVVCRRAGIRPYLLEQADSSTEDQLVPMGPLPGPKMIKSTGSVLQAEIDALQQMGMTMSDFDRSAKLTPGARRKMVEFPATVNVAFDEGAITTQFELASGTYATVLLSEVAGASPRNSTSDQPALVPLPDEHRTV